MVNEELEIMNPRQKKVKCYFCNKNTFSIYKICPKCIKERKKEINRNIELRNEPFAYKKINKRSKGSSNFAKNLILERECRSCKSKLTKLEMLQGFLTCESCRKNRRGIK